MRFRLFIIIFGFLLASCGSSPPVGTSPQVRAPALASQPEPSEPRATVRRKPVKRVVTDDAGTSFKVGLLLPLSGPQAELGRAFLQAAQMALFDIGNPSLVLLPRDVGTSPESAAAAAEAAIVDGAQLILGPVFSQSVVAAGAAAQVNNVPLVGFSNNRSIAGDGIYLTGFTPLEEVRRIVQYAVDKGHRSFAALIPETAYGDAVAAAFRDAVLAADAEISSMVTYPPQGDALFDPVKILADYDVRRQALKDEIADLERFGEDDDLALGVLERLRKLETLGELPYDAVLIPEGGALLRALGPLLPYYEIDPQDVQFLGTALWEDPALVREPPLQGAWFAGPPTDVRADFERRYMALYGDTPPQIATLAYDGIALAASLGLARTEALQGRPLPEDLLLSRNGFQGVDGIFRFSADGLAERGLAVKTFTRDGIRVISPAPTTFQARP